CRHLEINSLLASKLGNPPSCFANCSAFCFNMAALTQLCPQIHVLEQHLLNWFIIATSVSHHLSASL
ncbi:MAG: hypothetical protein ACREBR_01335, partial [bacterium]